MSTEAMAWLIIILAPVYVVGIGAIILYQLTSPNSRFYKNHLRKRAQRELQQQWEREQIRAWKEHYREHAC